MTTGRQHLIIEQVVANVSAAAAGPAYSVPSLCRRLISRGADLRLHTLEPLPDPADDYLRGYPTRSHGWLATRLGISSALQAGLADAAQRAGVIHSHGLWMMPNIYAHRAAAAAGCLHVVSPRGMMEPWAWRRSPGRKWVMWWLGGQRQAVRRASAFHATAPSELASIRDLGYRQPVAVIPNGIDLPDARAPIASRDRATRRLLNVGRLHPKKGLDSLIRAWSTVAADFRQWELHIVGPDESGHRAELESLASQLHAPRLAIREPVYGDEKTATYLDADVFVLPSHSENFGIVVAEALAHGVPAIVTVGAPWSGLRETGSGWWIEPGVDSVAAALQEAMGTPPAELAAMGTRGAEWMARDFGWDSIADRMLQFYQWLCDRTLSPPEFVDTAES